MVFEDADLFEIIQNQNEIFSCCVKGHLLVFGSSDGTVLVVDEKTNQLTNSWKISHEELCDLKYCPANGGTILSLEKETSYEEEIFFLCSYGNWSPRSSNPQDPELSASTSSSEMQCSTAPLAGRGAIEACALTGRVLMVGLSGLVSLFTNDLIPLLEMDMSHVLTGGIFCGALCNSTIVLASETEVYMLNFSLDKDMEAPSSAQTKQLTRRLSRNSSHSLQSNQSSSTGAQAAGLQLVADADELDCYTLGKHRSREGSKEATDINKESGLGMPSMLGDFNTLKKTNATGTHEFDDLLATLHIPVHDPSDDQYIEPSNVSASVFVARQTPPGSYILEMELYVDEGSWTEGSVGSVLLLIVTSKHAFTYKIDEIQDPHKHQAVLISGLEFTEHCITACRGCPQSGHSQFLFAITMAGIEVWTLATEHMPPGPGLTKTVCQPVLLYVLPLTVQGYMGLTVIPSDLLAIPGGLVVVPGSVQRRSDVLELSYKTKARKNQSKNAEMSAILSDISSYQSSWDSEDQFLGDVSVWKLESTGPSGRRRGTEKKKSITSIPLKTKLSEEVLKSWITQFCSHPLPSNLIAGKRSLSALKLKLSSMAEISFSAQAKALRFSRSTTDALDGSLPYSHFLHSYRVLENFCNMLFAEALRLSTCLHQISDGNAGQEYPVEGEIKTIGYLLDYKLHQNLASDFASHLGELALRVVSNLSATAESAKEQTATSLLQPLKVAAHWLSMSSTPVALSLDRLLTAGRQISISCSDSKSIDTAAVTTRVNEVVTQYLQTSLKHPLVRLTSAGKHSLIQTPPLVDKAERRSLLSVLEFSDIQNTNIDDIIVKILTHLEHHSPSGFCSILLTSWVPWHQCPLSIAALEQQLRQQRLYKEAEKGAALIALELYKLLGLEVSMSWSSPDLLSDSAKESLQSVAEDVLVKLCLSNPTLLLSPVAGSVDEANRVIAGPLAWQLQQHRPEVLRAAFTRIIELGTQFSKQVGWSELGSVSVLEEGKTSMFPVLVSPLAALDLLGPYAQEVAVKIASALQVHFVAHKNDGDESAENLEFTVSGSSMKHLAHFLLALCYSWMPKESNNFQSWEENSMIWNLVGYREIFSKVNRLKMMLSAELISILFQYMSSGVELFSSSDASSPSAKGYFSNVASAPWAKLLLGLMQEQRPKEEEDWGPKWLSFASKKPKQRPKSEALSDAQREFLGLLSCQEAYDAQLLLTLASSLASPWAEDTAPPLDPTTEQGIILMKLFCLPKLSRYNEAFWLLSETVHIDGDTSELSQRILMEYAKYFCSKQPKTWSHFLSFLASEIKASSPSEKAAYESLYNEVLDYLCHSLPTQTMLEALPNDMDLYVVLPFLENNIKLNHSSLNYH